MRKNNFLNYIFSYYHTQIESSTSKVSRPVMIKLIIKFKKGYIELKSLVKFREKKKFNMQILVHPRVKRPRNSNLEVYGSVFCI